MNVELTYIIDLSTQLNLNLIQYCDQLNSLNKGIMSNQLLQSGLEIGKLLSESKSAQSKLGLSHKLKSITSTLSTVQYALKLCQNSEGYPDTSHLRQQIIHLNREISTFEIISTKTP